jgi:anti-anti-sigma regulatory factor
MEGERLQQILDHIERLCRGDFQPHRAPSVDTDDFAKIASALEKLDARLKERGDLYQLTQQVSAINLKRLDGLLTELERANAVNQEQQATIRTLSSPILRVWDGILMMPVFGAVDDGDQAARMMEGLLDAVARSRSRYVIIDLTGAHAVAPILGEQVTRLLQAVQLLGAQGIVVGIRPEMAQAMVSGGVSFAGVPTLASVYDALVLCIRCLREDSLGAR